MVAGARILVLSGLSLLLLLLLLSEHVARAGAGSMLLMDPELPLKVCRYMRYKGFLQATCVDLKLNDIPMNLKSSIEILDAHENRIRDIYNDSLAKYTSLRYLYLQDNFLQNIAENAFESTYYLEALDLSKNGLLKLPKSLFQLQYLRNLYLSNNKLTDDVLEVKNVKSPLIWLHLSKNRLTQLPQLKPMVSLQILNVSHNEITRITAEDVAPLCSLKILDLTGNPIKFNASSCECYEFKEWCEHRKITLKFDKLDCPADLQERCIYRSPYDFSNGTLNLYNNCLLSLRDRAEAQKARSTWIWIASCIIAFMFCIFVALCCIHKRDRGKRRQLLKEQQIHAANNANTEQLLNKDPNHQQS